MISRCGEDVALFRIDGSGFAARVADMNGLELMEIAGGFGFGEQD